MRLEKDTVCRYAGMQVVEVGMHSYAGIAPMDVLVCFEGRGRGGGDCSLLAGCCSGDEMGEVR